MLKVRARKVPYLSLGPGMPVPFTEESVFYFTFLPKNKCCKNNAHYHFIPQRKDFFHITISFQLISIRSLLQHMCLELLLCAELD